MSTFHTAAFRRITRQFIMSYVLFILIPVLVLNVATSQAIRITEENAVHNNMSILNHSRSMIDTQLRSIDSVATQILTNSTLCDFQYANKLEVLSDYYPLWQTSQSFQNMRFLGDDITVFIYYRNNDIFLTPDTASNGLSRDYGSLYRFGEFSYQDFEDKLQATGSHRLFLPEMDVVIDGTHYHGMLYIMPLSVQHNPNTGATVYFMLEKSIINSLFSSVLDAGGSYFILDNQNQLLISGGNLGDIDPEAPLPIMEEEGLLDEEFYGRENIANYILSDYGLKLITVMPRDVAFSRVGVLRMLTLYLNLAAVALAVGYALYLSLKNSRRISDVLEKMSDGGLDDYNGKNVFEYLNNGMLLLTNSNRSLKMSIESQIPFLRMTFLDRLVNGSFSSDTELFDWAGKVNFPVSGKYYCIMVLLLENEQNDASAEAIQEFSQKKQEVFLEFRSLFEDRGLICGPGIDQIVILCIFEKDEAPQYRTIVEEKISVGIEQVYSRTGIVLRCAGSDLYDKITDTCENFSLCRDLFLRYSFLEMQSAVLWNKEEYYANRNLFVYPPEFEGKLLRQIKAGDTESALLSIQQIIQKNFGEQPLSTGMSQLFIWQIKLSLFKATDDSGETGSAGEKLLALRSRTPVSQLYPAVSEIVCDLCRVYARRSSEKLENIRKEMVTFVDENFRDPNLSLRYAADHFNLSEAYFSQLFKNVAEEKFSVYLDRCRMQYAHELLCNTNKTVEEIAADAGYTLSSTFRRAYKRFYGVSPTQNRTKQ